MVNELDNDTRVIVEATVGPWESLRLVSGKGEALLRFGDRSLQMPEGDAAFTARARTRYPELVAEVRELRSEVAMLRRHLERQGWKPLKEGDWQTLTKTTGGVGPLQEAP